MHPKIVEALARRRKRERDSLKEDQGPGVRTGPCDILSPASGSASREATGGSRCWWASSLASHLLAASEDQRPSKAAWSDSRGLYGHNLRGPVEDLYGRSWGLAGRA